MTKESVWVIGQAVSAVMGLFVAYATSFSIGLAYCFSMMVLIDIRRELNTLNEKKPMTGTTGSCETAPAQSIDS